MRVEGGRLGINVRRMIGMSLVCMLNGQCTKGICGRGFISGGTSNPS